MIAALLLLLASGAPALQAQEESPPEGPPYRVGGDVTRPKKVSGPPPVYTEVARKARVQGVVIIETLIDEHGDVTNTRVIKGLPMGLEEAAVEAVRAWKFEPATLGGRPVPVYYVLTVNFTVEAPPAVGPRFQAFLEKNPDFAALFREEHYQEAAELLDRRAAEQPGDSGIQLARSYLLLEQGQEEKAWQEALADRALAAAPQSQEGPTLDKGTSGEILHVAGRVQRPERISGDSPQMPKKARKAGVSGTVIIAAVIDEQGNVQDARIVQGLHADLDREVLKAIRGWKFKPATLDGKPVKVHYNTTFNFR